MQSVIQANQQSVIQTPSNIQLPKGNVILVKPNSVIQTTPGTVQTLQVKEMQNLNCFYQGWGT